MRAARLASRKRSILLYGVTGIARCRASRTADSETLRNECDYGEITGIGLFKRPVFPRIVLGLRTLCDSSLINPRTYMCTQVEFDCTKNLSELCKLCVPFHLLFKISRKINIV